MKDRQLVKEALCAPFPAGEIKQRPGGGGRSLSYISTTTVIQRLNEATDNEWSSTVDRYWTEGKMTMALVTLTIPGLGSRSHIGVQVEQNNQGEDAATKGAISDGLKKAATLFGVGLQLYVGDYGGQDYRQEDRGNSNQGQRRERQQRPYNRPDPDNDRRQDRQQERGLICNIGGCGVVCTQGQALYSETNMGAILCPFHQQEFKKEHSANRR